MKSNLKSNAAVKRIKALLLLVTTLLVVLVWVAYPHLRLWAQSDLQPFLEQQGIHVAIFPTQPIALASTNLDQAVSAAQTAARGATLVPTIAIVQNTPDQNSVPTATPAPVTLQNNGAASDALRQQGVMVLAMRDGNYIHLFAYHPLYLPLTRLTNNPWDDITPALSPDGGRLAYSSRQNGYWDLYVLDLKTGQKTRLTDTPEYEGSPSWSPDGQWIAYEKYNGISLDVYIQSLVDPKAAPIQLTDDPGIDRAPAWSPKGREIAFVSTRSGSEAIWLARLDDVDHRFVNISNSPLTQNQNPVWSADGSYLAWSSSRGGNNQLIVWDAAKPDVLGHPAGEGKQAAWGPDNSVLFSEVRDQNGSGIAAYRVADGRLSTPYVHTPGAIYGMTWVKGPLPDWLAATLQHPDQAPAPTLWAPVLTKTVQPVGRKGLIPLPDVTAPQPMLQDEVDEAFNALRQQVAQETGWDALSSLDNAYVPLTSPITPSIQEDWLYTGRAFALNQALLSAGWMTLSREDFNGQTYWHVYLKARYQDGSMGKPLDEMAWDMNARFNGDTRAYEQGGKEGAVPGGYWIDLTELTQRYGWERLPSLTNWRTFYPSIRYNLFVMTGGMEWQQAMGELYPQEALATTTPLPTITPMITLTPKVTGKPPTQTPTPTQTMIPTRRPTWTPLPQQPAP